MISRLRPHLGWPELLAPLGRGSVGDFERAFAETFGQRHAVAFPYGRTGLICLLKALGLADAEVICPAYTCIVVPHAIRFSGNTPIFVDCAAGSYLMDLDLAEEAITQKTGAIIATSLFGHPVDLDRLAALRERHPGVAIIQDCAHSFAASWKGRPVQREGVAALFGLNASKLISSIFGGMVSLDDEDLAERLRAVRDIDLAPKTRRAQLARLLYLWAVVPALHPLGFAVVSRLQRSGWLDRFVRYYDETEIDMPADHLARMCAFEARVGLAQLRRYPAVIEGRRRRARRYLDALADVPHLELPPDDPGATWSHFVVSTDAADAYVAEGLAHGVELGRVVEYSIPDLVAYREHRFVDRGVARAHAQRVLNLPIHHGVSDRALERIVTIVRKPPAPGPAGGTRT